jgi:hypothetical protein
MQTKSGSYGGQLETIDVSKNVHLWELDCSGNKLEEVDVSNNPNLQTLICTDNPIEEVILAPDQVVATLETPVASNVVYEWEDAEAPAPDEIWYTSQDDNVLSLREDATFGDATVVSNTYTDGKGVIKFNTPVSTVGRAAFYLSQNLTSITLPEGLTSIEDNAFDMCNNLVSVTLPSTLTEIHAYAFWNCHKLTYVTIPENVTVLDDGIFTQCFALKAFQGKYATSDRKCLIKDGRLIAFAPVGQTDYTIPSQVTSLGDQVFRECADLKSIVIPEGVTSIGFSAFGLCESLEEITIPQSVTSFGTYVFEGCRSLQSVYGKFASDDHRCLVVGGKLIAFACVGLTEYTIPSNVTHIEFGVFTDCRSLTSVTIPGSVTFIEDYAFTGCTSLRDITVFATVPPEFPDWMEDPAAFDDTNNCPIYVPAASVNAYKQAAGWNKYADRITAVSSGAVAADFPDEHFRAYVFENFDTDKNGVLSSAECDAVTSINVCTDSIASLEGLHHFQNLTQLTCGGTLSEVDYSSLGLLTELDVSSNLQLQYLGCYQNRLTSLDVSKNTELTDLNCFHNQLTSLNVSKNTELTDLNCPSNQLTSLDLSNNTKLRYLSCNGNSLSSLDLSNNTALKTVYCGINQLTSLNLTDCTALEELFCYRNQLESLDVSDNTSLTVLDCKNNPMITLYMASGQQIQNLEKESSTEIVYIGSGPAANEIWYTSTDGNVVEPNKADVFGAGIVSNTYSVGKGVIVFDGPVTMVGEEAFYKCETLSSVTLPYTVQQLGGYSFYKCSALQDISIPEQVASIGNYAFASCSSLQEFTIPEGVSNLYGVFASCTSLVRFKGKFADASGRALISGTTLMAVAAAGLTSYAVPEGIEVISAGVFSGRANLTEITLPDGLLSIGNEAFKESGITELIIPESVGYIGFKAFSWCSNLVSIKLPDGIEAIQNELFSGCEKLKNVVIPQHVTSISNYAFRYCSSLTSLVIPAAVTSLGSEAFFSCSALQSLVLQSAVPPAGGRAMMSETTCPIYVPASSVDAYKTADEYWSSYADRIQPVGAITTTVDLGLSVKWAAFNLGAYSPEGFGNYYAWGETSPKTDYSWSTYVFNPSGDGSTFTKYTDSSNATLLPSDDAATVVLGGAFRMPTEDEWTELKDNCDWVWTANYKETGVAGAVVTSKVEGYTDKSIFLPAYGYMDGPGLFNLSGFYWSSSLYLSHPALARCMNFGGSTVQWYMNSRYRGCFVRPVYTN